MKFTLTLAGTLLALPALALVLRAEPPATQGSASTESAISKEKGDMKEKGDAMGMVADSPQTAKPLAVGSLAPDAALTGLDGKPVSLGADLKKQPTVLIFYRGSWCPYCNMHLAQLQTVEPQLKQMGYQILAVTPDKPEDLRKTMDKHKLGYTLLSDSDARAMRAYGVAFRLDDATIEKYKQYHVDLEAAAGGRKHHILPVPSVFLIGTDRIIRYVHSNPDYKVRLSSDELLKAAKTASMSPAPSGSSSGTTSR